MKPNLISTFFFFQNKRYEKIFAVYISEKNQEIMLYQILKEAVILAYKINLHLDGPIGLNVIDNILIVHNLSSKVKI